MTSRLLNIFLFLSFSALVILLSMTRYSDFDLWWHMKLGQSLIDNGQLFTHDTFSYTYAGQPQYTGEWLADLLIYASYLFAGLLGINLLKAVVLLIASYFLNQAVRTAIGNDKAGKLAAFAILILVIFAVRFRLFVRPYLFSLAFVSVFIYMLEKSRRGEAGKLLYLLPLTEILWANMSVGAIFGPFIATLYLLQDAVRNRGRFRQNLIVLMLTAAATLASPEFSGLYVLMWHLFTDPFKAVVGEYQPMSFQILWGYGLRYTWAYQIITVLALIYFLLFRGWKNTAHILMFCFFFVATLLQVRMIEFFAFVAAPMAAIPLQRLLSRLRGGNERRSIITESAMVILVIFSIPLSIYDNQTYPFGNDIKPDTFPEEALTFLDEQGISGTMFNGYSVGGYIIWRAPHRKVFFDGRYRRLYSSQFYREYAEIMQNPLAWMAGELKYGFDYAVVEYEMLSRRFPTHLSLNPAWALVYWDNHSAVYLKRTQRFEKVIAAYEYRVLRPNFYDFSYLFEDTTRDLRTLLPALQREINLNPNNQEPLLAKALVLFRLGMAYQTDMEMLLDAALRLKPDLAMEHSARAYLYMEKEKLDLAREEVLRAIELDPNDPGALSIGDKLGMRLKRPKQVTH